MRIAARDLREHVVLPPDQHHCMVRIGPGQHRTGCDVSQSNSSDRVRVRLLRMPPWLAVLMAVALLAILVTIAIVAFGVFLIVFPTLVIAGALFRLFGRGRVWPADHGPVSHPTIIEGEYRVIGTKRLDRDQSD
jgi:hypothetical protein